MLIFVILVCPPTEAGVRRFWCPSPDEDGNKRCVDADQVVSRLIVELLSGLPSRQSEFNKNVVPNGLPA